MPFPGGRGWRPPSKPRPAPSRPIRPAHWAACGINRVSLGVQSFVEKEIRRTGRKHTAEMVARKCGCCARPAIGSINIDLIAGLSGQTEASWRESLDWIERLEPEHVSVYMLEVDEDSRLGKEMLAGGARYGAAETPDDDQVATFYEIAVERLAGLGLARYEISNFARTGWESRHNLKYWKLEPYVGFGADAHSFDGRMRTQNAETLEEYFYGGGPGRGPASHAGRTLLCRAAVDGGHPARRSKSGSATTRRSDDSWMPACLKRTAACCACPTAACWFPTKYSPEFLTS